jgi:hypothetical protein
MNYLAEFPHYDDLIPLPEGYEDMSWHNDICPHIERSINPVTSVAIWCDFKEYSKREMGSMFRFTVALQDDIEKQDKGYFDNFEDALLFANALHERITNESISA